MELKLLGTRVVRGRDWKWENQDGGEGCLGTVVQIGQDEKSPFTEQLVWVQWDCGRKANYRAGVQGKYDLRVFESSNQGVRHVHVCCDGCNQDPIVGFRWHCLDCPNYDLCTTCYMTDIHDVTHSFERIDKSRAKGVPVGARQGSIKLEARGMFKGAKVVRGPDWEWKGTDGGTEMEGEVTEITGWSDESTNDAVRVAWKKGPKENLYRLGTNGKVDLKCTVLAVGGSYYRDHLPPLTVEFKTSQSGFTTGDKVCVQQLTAEKLKELSAGHGGWNPDMEKFIRKVGVVQGFTLNGDVVVEYPERRWRYNPAALTKIQNFKRGDEVVIKSDKNLVKDLQDGHGGWNESMISILGRTGAVLEVHNDGDLLVLVDGEQWMLNPAAVTYVTEPEPGQNPESSDDPLGLFTLFRDFLLRQATQGGANIVVAAKTNQVSRVREILDAHPEVINETQDGHTALHVACHEGHCDVITELLDRGADRNILDVQGYTAMHHAAYADKSGEALKLLLEKGFSPNVQHNSNKSSPLHLAVKRDNETAVRILSQCTECNVNLQDTDGDTPLHDAIAGEKHSMVDMLLESPRISMDISNERGFNYLQYAILKGNKQAVEKLLVKAGDVLNVTKSDGFTTLHIAAINDHREIAKMLLNQPGCQVDALTTDNQSSLHVAASEGYSLMVEILLDHGAHVNVVDNDGDTPLHIALAKESFLRTDMMSELPSLQLLFRLTGDSRSYAAVSRCLISYGADVRKRNAKGETPLDRCRGSEVEQLIREIAPFGGTSQNKKVPSFGGRRQSQNREESNNVSSVSSSATQEEATQTVDEEQGTRTGEDNEIQQVEGEDDNNMNHDEQAEQEMNELENQEEKDEQRSDAPPKNENLVTNPVERESSYQEEMNEQENQEEKDNQKTEAVPKDENLVENSLERESSYQENIVVEVTNQAQEMTTDTEFSNNSEIAPDVIAVNNADSANVDIECTALEAQAEGNKECNDQVTENMDEDKPTATEGDDQKPKCQICEENEAVVAFKPCGHTVLCIECAPRLKRCLECKAEITGKGTRDGTPVVGINNKSLVTKYQKLEGKLRKMEESIVCCICVERKKNIIFLCGHGTCHSCAEQLKVCHICQKPIEKKISFF